MQEGRYEAIKLLINEKEDYVCPLNDKTYFSHLYDEIVSLSKQSYNNDQIDQYKIERGLEDIFSFDYFIGITHIDENYDVTGDFLLSSLSNEEVIPTEVTLHCRISKDFLQESSITEIVALTLLQIAFIKEWNESCHRKESTAS